MSHDFAQQRLFSAIETPHPPAEDANAKDRLLAALMIRFDVLRSALPGEHWDDATCLALLAVLKLANERIYRVDGELPRLWQNITERHATKDRFWTSSLPYALVAESFSSYGKDAIEKLGANLDHHNSGIRMWTLEMGWILRRRWSVNIRPRLFEAFGGNIFDPDEAMALAYIVSENWDEFIRAADAYVPERHAAQYRDRLASVRRFPSAVANGFRLGTVEYRVNALIFDELERL